MQLGFLAGPTVILQKTDQSRKTDGNNSSDHLGWTLVPKVQFGEKGSQTMQKPVSFPLRDVQWTQRETDDN